MIWDFQAVAVSLLAISRHLLIAISPRFWRWCFSWSSSPRSARVLNFVFRLNCEDDSKATKSSRLPRSLNLTGNFSSHVENELESYTELRKKIPTKSWSHLVKRVLCIRKVGEKKIPLQSCNEQSHSLHFVSLARLIDKIFLWCFNQQVRLQSTMRVSLVSLRIRRKQKKTHKYKPQRKKLETLDSATHKLNIDGYK